jgi:hypothetical protein
LSSTQDHVNWHQHKITSIDINTRSRQLTSTHDHVNWHQHKITSIDINTRSRQLTSTQDHVNWHQHKITSIDINTRSRQLTSTHDHVNWHQHKKSRLAQQTALILLNLIVPDTSTRNILHCKNLTPSFSAILSMFTLVEAFILCNLLYVHTSRSIHSLQPALCSY